MQLSSSLRRNHISPWLVGRTIIASLVLMAGAGNAQDRGQGAVGSQPSIASAKSVHAEQETHWQVVETANFTVYCVGEPGAAVNLADHCESLRARLQHKWFGDSFSATAWRPRCLVVLHPTRTSYLQAVGPAGTQTSGTSHIEARDSAITYRRIDLCGFRVGQETAALPHELTHVVFADRFRDRPVPPWANEGAAVLADPAEKQQLHLRDLREALAEKTTFTVGQLVELDRCPDGPQCGTFYGQSLSLVECLVRRGGPRTFVAFLDRSALVGNDRALEETYGTHGVRELDHVWREHASAPATEFVAEHTPRPASSAESAAD